MTVVPLDIKEGMGVGTTFRIIGDFSGKRLEWDCETLNLSEMRKLLLNKLKSIKKWEITNEFKSLGDNLTRITMSVDYKMPFGPLGAILDKANLQNLLIKEWKLHFTMLEDYLKEMVQFLYITLDAYQKLLAEKKKMTMSQFQLHLQQF